MKGIVLPSVLRKAEKRLMESGITEDELIARAAVCLFNEVERYGKDKRILAVAGCGNNGCDALECALLLNEKGFCVSVMTVGDTPNEGNRVRRNKIKERGIALVNAVSGCDIIIDGIFGIGLTRETQGEYAQAIRAINESGVTVISADIPSGLCAETGKALGETVIANKTVTFSYIKVGMLTGVGRNYCGEITTGDIGIECEYVGEISRGVEIPKRKTCSHKGDYGRVKIIGGSETMVGAPLMSYESAVAAARSGAGLTTLCVPKSLALAYQARVKETMLCFLPDEDGKIKFSPSALDGVMKDASAIVIGPGLGKSAEVLECVRYLAKSFTGTLIVDADALNSLSADLTAIEGHACKLILTPHIGEFNRLCPDTDRIEDIKAFAKKHECVLCLKSATTVITDGDEVYFNLTGTPALAKGGSGDLLCGIIAAFSCVLPPLKAAIGACYHFGKCAERAESRLNSEISVLASDIIIEINDNA